MKRAFHYLIAGVLLSTSGCVPLMLKLRQDAQQQHIQEALQTRDAALNQCKADGELTRKNVIKRTDCMAAVMRRFAYDSGNASTEWILEQNIVADRQSALQYAKGKIDIEEFKNEFLAHRATGAQLEATAQYQQRGQNIQLLSVLPKYTPPPVQPVQAYAVPQNRSVDTNCDRIGNSINCTSTETGVDTSSYR